MELKKAAFKRKSFLKLLMEKSQVVFDTIIENPDSGVFRQIPLNIGGKLYTSPMPFGGYDKGSKLLKIYKKAHIDHVVVMVTDEELKKKARRDPFKQYRDNNISYSRFIIKDFQSPSIEVLTALVSETTERLHHQRVCIHCHAGVGRTSVAASCIVMAVEHFDTDKAVKYVSEYMTINITSEQKNLIRKYEQSYIMNPVPASA